MRSADRRRSKHNQDQRELDPSIAEKRLGRRRETFEPDAIRLADKSAAVEVTEHPAQPRKVDALGEDERRAGDEVPRIGDEVEKERFTPMLPERVALGWGEDRQPATTTLPPPPQRGSWRVRLQVLQDRRPSAGGWTVRR